MLRAVKNGASAVAALLVLCAAASAQQSRAIDAAKTLHDFFAAEWDYQMEQHPTWASSLGDRRWNDRWSDSSLDAIYKRHNHDIATLSKLTKIDRAALSPSDQLNYDLFKKDYENDIEDFQYRWYLLPLNQLGGVHTVNQLAETLRFDTLKDYEDWLARLKALPVRVDQTISLMRIGMKERIILPKIVVQRVPAQIDHQIVSDPKASPLYKPFTKFSSSIAESDQVRLAKAGQVTIADTVVPAYRKLKEFVVNDYLPAAWDQVGIWQLPNGAAMYASATRHNTTTDLSPQQIHEIGLKEVKRIRAEMQAIIDKLGFRGSFTEFTKFLHGDEKFYFKSERELLEAYRALSRRIDPLLVKVFRTLPRMPYGIEPLPANIAPDSPAGLYRGPAADGSRAGTFSVNTFKPEIRPKYEMMALSLHEGVPGHHLQIALAMEQQGIPNFRRYGGYTAFIEGWGLYAESLGDEMGLYDDPYSKFGQLMYEIWRASRLVVDTGMHYLRWDRQRAIDFMVANTAKQELEVTAEIDRYIVWPGQALAYKIGQLKITELRAKAKQALGDEFDVRDFHDELLKDGALPLDRLEVKMNAWIARQK
ncbi:MAG TPA: DUF885 domain-containing protein, partial [Candidatus Binatia bacterium]|nr:DUF885 domain-containing protein [Candidatus Binatia bacterium]